MTTNSEINERVAKLEAEFVSIEKKLDIGFSNIQTAIRDNYSQMENLVNNGLHQAQNIAQLSREDVSELKPKLDHMEKDIVNIRVRQAGQYTNEQINGRFKSINTALENINNKLSKSILKQSGLVIGIGVVVYIVNNPNILSFLMGR